MTVVPDGTGRIKVVLSSEDVYELGISVETIDCSDPDTRLMLRALFKTATEKIGVDKPTHRLLIEAYPHIGGGGVLYFTPLEPQKQKKLKIKNKKKAPEEYIYEFADGSDLMNAINVLYNNCDTKMVASRLYDVDGKFFLTLDNTPKKILPLYEAKEFCEHFYKTTEQKKYTCEHGIALTGENAVYEIGSKIN